MQELRLTYPRNLFELWRSGEIAGSWHVEYPLLFKDSDWRTIRNQYALGYHFGEWFSARHFWNAGHRVLIEKYVFPGSHREDFAIAERLLGKEALLYLKGKARQCQPPDLLVYLPDFSSFFFAEIKLESDVLREEQRVYFDEVEKLCGCEVWIVKLSGVEDSRDLPAARTAALFH